MKMNGATGGRRRGAEVPGSTGLAICSAELSADACLAVADPLAAPGHRCLALRTGDLLVVPVDREVRQVVALSGARRPARGAPHRSFERDAVVPLAAGQQTVSTLSNGSPKRLGEKSPLGPAS